jgi:hypothetical protein
MDEKDNKLSNKTISAAGWMWMFITIDNFDQSPPFKTTYRQNRSAHLLQLITSVVAVVEGVLGLLVKEGELAILNHQSCLTMCRHCAYNMHNIVGHHHDTHDIAIAS